MSSSYGIPIFKTESINDLTTEQYRVLVLALGHFNKTMEKEHKQAMRTANTGDSKRTTYRITTQHGK